MLLELRLLLELTGCLNLNMNYSIDSLDVEELNLEEETCFCLLSVGIVKMHVKRGEPNRPVKYAKDSVFDEPRFLIFNSSKT